MEQRDDVVVFAAGSAPTDEEIHALFAASWPNHEPRSFRPILARSLTWVTARRRGHLVAFVNVVGDGGLHAFILDTTVHPNERRRGLGVRIVRYAAEEARRLGAAWLHVDYEAHLQSFYERCGFGPTAAGLMRL
ncbi:GNAT family N-acetyltransferase [Pendulispora rubella]|uniref:GNAT family N-acetyltransferase n=1 Tax=Pendulispora rubella TaxID=2741070 RepID=A0ABZ2L5K8_9BACT